ncbi:ABC transporter permease subunit [Azohydromonas sediminis]|uniref:ABC transporter permease subunit n=1 Tax=Azohydromonas sediminis TaxID=2259674 RepID=UPI000E651818|nr:ABC transporter permease subunit [Azohydromonas sediminis]
MSTSAPVTGTVRESVDRAMGRRLLLDRLFKSTMSAGGIGVIVAITAIFFYLASVVVPIFVPPDIEARATYALPGAADTTTGLLVSEEQREIGVRFDSAGEAVFFRFGDGGEIARKRLAVGDGVQITSMAAGERRGYTFAYGLSNGRVVLAKHVYNVTFPGGKRLITPDIEYPLGDQPLVVDERGAAIDRLAFEHNEDGTTIVARTVDGRLLVSSVSVTTNLMTGETKSEVQNAEISPVPADIRDMIVEWKQRELYVLHGDRSLTRFDISNKSAPRRVETVEVAPAGERVTAMTILSGGYSLVFGTDKGSLSQWFLVRRDGADFDLRKIREFTPMPAPIVSIAPEFFRKAFVVGDQAGNFGSYFATSRRLLFVEKLSDQPLVSVGIPHRGNGYLAQDAKGRLHVAAVHNDFPEVSFEALWQKVWYESYEHPDYVWQSSAGHSDFEPKFSLAPLTFGTIKAATYAMAVAVPLAILGAIFTAYFMAPRMRQIVKPTIEVMEALPTVILGFLAGLWLAPFVENNLAGVLMALLLMPLSFVIAAYAWHLLPEGFKQRIGAGWEAAILIPFIMVLLWLFMQLGHPVEAAFFGGDMPNWLSNVAGIDFEQRNSLVVGIAMGFAVTPTIFSIAEDAIFSVPKSLTSGSLALGATPWQTLMGVVMPTASPGIFSAVMIGLGRAVGETMIVLMATGNTAVMNFSLFTGFRTLSANIGVEMPEAGVGETHYRLLFLSALVLFVFTFVVNTAAEIVRQRLREKYQTV